MIEPISKLWSTDELDKLHKISAEDTITNYDEIAKHVGSRTRK